MLTVAPSPTARGYSSPVRAAKARDTKRRIIAAAQTLFLEHGYPASTLAQVASAAGVSTDTVYKVFGSKIGLLKELLDVVVGGDDEPVALLDRPGPQQLHEEQDVREQIRLLAHGVSGQLDQIRPMDDILRSAATVDPEAAALRHDIQDRQRHAAMELITSWLHLPGTERDPDDVDAVWALTSPELHELLRTRRGWSAERYAAWLTEMLTAALLDR